MIKILKYSFFDLMRSRWSYVYFAFYLLLGFVLLFLNTDVSKAVITLMNVVIILVPLMGTLFGVMYYYNSKEFIELLLAQPIKRTSIFIGQYLGVATSLTFSLIVGLGIPFLVYGIFKSDAILDFSLLLVTGIFNLYFHGHFILHRAFQRKQNKRIWLRYRVLVVYGSNLRWVVFNFPHCF